MAQHCINQTSEVQLQSQLQTKLQQLERSTPRTLIPNSSCRDSLCDIQFLICTCTCTCTYFVEEEHLKLIIIIEDCSLHSKVKHISGKWQIMRKNGKFQEENMFSMAE